MTEEKKLDSVVIEATNAAGHAGKQPEPKDKAGSWTPAIALSALLLAGFVCYRTEFAPASADGIYVVDGIRLTRSYQALSENERAKGIKSAEKINEEAYAMEQAINEKIASMANDGKVVIQKQSAMAYPPESDMTADIAKSLNIPLVADVISPRSNQSEAKIPNSLPKDAVSAGNGADLD